MTEQSVKMETEEMAEALASFFDIHLSRGGHSCSNLVRLSGGASRETFAFELSSPDSQTGPSSLVLQRVRAGALSAASSMEAEATLLRGARAGGVCVADVFASCDDPSVLGSPFLVVGRVQGETIARRILREDEFEQARGRLVEQAGAALARIHALPLDVAPHLRADEPVAQMLALLDMVGESHPAFELVIRWLEDNRPAEQNRVAVVHGDFRLGNLVVDADGLVAVLDWELAHIGDPMEDLGWFCVRAWRFGSRMPVAGVGEYQELFDAYSLAAGVSVSAAVVRWWEVLGTLRWGIICILQARGHLSGASRSVELAAIGRRTVENEYDALVLLDVVLPAGSSMPRADSAGFDSGPHDAPTAVQLVEAVREFLERDVMGATDSRVQFHTRVATKVLGMVERELTHGASMAEAHRARLADLGFNDDRALAAAIRAGELDERRVEVTQAVFATVLDKLAVANPDYA